MPQKYKTLILDYCAKYSIFVPAGFGRNSPSHFVVIRTDLTPPKLVATTWFKQADVIYYFEHFLVPQIGVDAAVLASVIDFKDKRKFRYTKSNTLEADGSL